MPWIYVNNSNLLHESRSPGGSWVWDTFYKSDPRAKHSHGGWNWGPPQANHPANVEALSFVVEMQKQSLSPRVSQGGGGLLQGFFTASKLAMTPAGGFWAGGLHTAGLKPNAFDVQFFPKWKSQRHQFGTAGLIIMRRSKNKELAWEYIKYRVSRSVMGQILKDNSTTPVRKSLLSANQYAPTGPKHWNVFYDTLEKLPSAPIPAPNWYQTMNTIFLKYTDLAMTGQQSPKQALDNMQKDLEAAYKKR
jgi:ABC-type glycerol-3-phosphate transport system substrate-binding protein